MIEHLLRQLQENRSRWLIVTAGTSVLALAALAPLVDQLHTRRSERASLQEQLTQADHTVEQTPDLLRLLQQQTVELEQFEKRSVTEDRVGELRAWLVDSARESGCGVRRIDLQPARLSPWAPGDDPRNVVSKQKKETTYQLRTQPVIFSVSGTEQELRSLLQVVEQDDRIKHLQAIELKQTARTGSRLQLDLTLWYFALTDERGAA